MTPAEFKTLLLEVRDAAASEITPTASDSAVADARHVWDAAEVALAMLDHRYIPKRAAQLEVADLLRNVWPPDPTETAPLN